MPNVAQVLKEEIQRLARKEIREATASLRKDNVALKRVAADHKRRLTALERENRKLVAEAEKRRQQDAVTTEDEVEKARVSAKMVRAVRARLSLSQAELGELVGVNKQTVYMWEHKEGRLSFRGDAKAALVAVRKLSQEEAQQQLEALQAEKTAKGRARRRKKLK